MVRTEGPSSEGDQVAEWWKTFRIERQQGGYIVRQYAASRPAPRRREVAAAVARVIAATVVLVVIGWLLIALVAGACWWIATGHLP